MDSSRSESPPKIPPPKGSSSNHRESHRNLAGDYGIDSNDRRFAFSRTSSFRYSDPQSPVSIQRSNSIRPNLDRSDSSISIDDSWKGFEKPIMGVGSDGDGKSSVFHLLVSLIRAVRCGNRSMKRLALMISLNVAYSTTELMIGLFTGRVGLVSDAFHLTFGCGILTFSLFAMAASRKKPDGVYTYGYKRLEVLAAFTNALFLVFMSFSLAVEALHAFVQDESDHKHYLIVSAVTNLLVNLLGVWFFRSYARVNIVYRKAEDMNNHSVCLHVLADSIRRDSSFSHLWFPNNSLLLCKLHLSAGLILASWFLSLGVENAEALCLGLVAIAVLMVILPLFQATGSILLQMAPANIPYSALSKCHRQITALEDVSEVSQARFWEVVPGHAVGSVSIQVKKGVEDYPILHHLHGLYHDLGIQDMTIQTDYP